MWYSDKVYIYLVITKFISSKHINKAKVLFFLHYQFTKTAFIFKKNILQHPLNLHMQQKNYYKAIATGEISLTRIRRGQLFSGLQKKKKNRTRQNRIAEEIKPKSKETNAKNKRGEKDEKLVARKIQTKATRIAMPLAQLSRISFVSRRGSKWRDWTTKAQDSVGGRNDDVAVTPAVLARAMNEITTVYRCARTSSTPICMKKSIDRAADSRKSRS